MEQKDFPSSSDDSDDDYNPGGEDSDFPSEVDSEGEEENCQLSGNEDEEVGRKRKGRRKKGKIKRSRKMDANESEDPKPKENQKELSQEEEKKRADSLWANFSKDVGVVPRQNLSTNGNAVKSGESSVEKKVTVTKVFEFAGEEVRVEKQVPIDSAEAKGPILKSKGVGLSSVLGQLGKKNKIGTLEKSKLDWDKYKQQAGLEEEIKTHNKGKGGYLEKQDFLQRTDVRQFEIERDLRMKKRSNR